MSQPASQPVSVSASEFVSGGHWIEALEPCKLRCAGEERARIVAPGERVCIEGDALLVELLALAAVRRAQAPAPAPVSEQASQRAAVQGLAAKPRAQPKK